MMMVDERGAVAARLAYVDDVTTPCDGPTFLFPLAGKPYDGPTLYTLTQIRQQQASYLIHFYDLSLP